MEDPEESVKGQSRLAVFEHIKTEKKSKKKRPLSRRYSDDSSQSETELIIDEDVKSVAKKRSKLIKFSEEILEMQCGWQSCGKTFSEMKAFNLHLVSHTSNDDLDCKWTDCPTPLGIDSYRMLLRHLSYHCYLTKLKNIGENVLNRTTLPECIMKPEYSIIVNIEGYFCEWTGCFFYFNTINDFLAHVGGHILGVPSGKEKGLTVIILCEWKGCNKKFSTRFKLAEHMRIHTKEKMIACPNCMALFTTKTLFSDHRRRQMKAHLRRYQCSQCLKLFPSERLLSDHVRSHINQYKCTMCDMTSPKPSILAKHYRYRHINYRPFKCPECDKKFVEKCNLNVHLLSHQSKPFKCNVCTFGCKSKVGLESHYAKKHYKIKPKYECHVCKAKYLRGDYLTGHLIKNHQFHWPSGHSRFRYRKDADGICRLQMVRYESLEVTEEMIKSESMKCQNVSTVTCQNDENGTYKMIISQNEVEIAKNDDKGNKTEPAPDSDDVLITIEDVDNEGKILNSQVIKSSILMVSSDSPEDDKVKVKINEVKDETDKWQSIAKYEDGCDK